MSRLAIAIWSWKDFDEMQVPHLSAGFRIMSYDVCVDECDLPKQIYFLQGGFASPSLIRADESGLDLPPGYSNMESPGDSCFQAEKIHWRAPASVEL